MNLANRMSFYLCAALITVLFLSAPVSALAQPTPNLSIDEAKTAIEQAIKSGAEATAPEDLAAARSWLSQAVSANSFFNNLVAIVLAPEVKKAREEEIVYLASMANLKAQAAEAKAKRLTTMATAQKVQRELADFENALALVKLRQADADKARAELAKVQATAADSVAKAQAATTDAQAKHAQELKAKADQLDQAIAEHAKVLAELKALEARRIADAAKKCVELEFKEGSEQFAACVVKLTP